MLPRERVDAAFELKQPDKIPIYQAGFSSFVASYILGRTAYVGGGIQQYRESLTLWEGGSAHEEFVEKSFEDACELCDKLDLDLVRTIYWRKSERPAERIDELTFLFGSRRGKSDDRWEIWRFDPPTETYGCVDYEPKTDLTDADLQKIADEAIRREESYAPTVDDFPEQQKAIARFGADRGIHGTGMSLTIPREREWLEATVLNPGVVARLLDAQVIGAAKTAPVMAELGLRYCFGGGDFAGTMGPFYSPQSYHELMLPRLIKISDACHSAGVCHLVASDGDLWPVADDLFGASNVDGFYEVDRNFMPIPDLRERFPPLVMLGGIRSEVLHRGTVSEVREETRSALNQAREAKGCIIGCSNQIVSGTPEENFWAMMEELESGR